jgi:hypothetical protein
LFGCWLFGNKSPAAHTNLSAAVYLLHKVVGVGAMNKFGIWFPWCRELFKTQNFVFPAANGPTLVTAQIVSYRHWELRKECLNDSCSDVETSANTLAALQKEWETQFGL